MSKALLSSRLKCVCCSVFLLVFSGGAVAADYDVAKFNFLRYNEDWSILKDVDRDELADKHRFKYVPLSEDGDIWVSFGGHVQARYEDHNNFAFGDGPAFEDNFILYRFLFHADWHFGENVRVFSEFKHADSTIRTLPGGARNIDVDETELQQLFVDYKISLGADNQSLTFRAGRQEYGFGKSRLVSPLPWANALRQWDGLTAIYKAPNLTVTGFASRFVPVDQQGFNNGNGDSLFFGAYATQVLSPASGFDYYWLGIDREDRSFNGTFGDESRQTFGARHWGKINNIINYDLEAAYQTGEVGSENISAFMFSSEVSHVWTDSPLKPRFAIGFDYASGDDEAGGSVNTFNQLFPLGHAYFGFIDIVARQNIVDFSSTFSLKPTARSTFRIGAHFFSRADSADGLYNAGGGLVRAGDPNASKNIGTEIDLTFSYKVTSLLTASVGFSRLFAGDFLSDTGNDEDIDFAYVQLLLNF